MLDLTKLIGTPKNDAPKRPVSDLNKATQGNIPAENKNAVAGRIDALPTADTKSPGTSGAELPELTPLQAGKLLQEKIMKGECSIWAINHAMKRNAPPEEIALIAVKGLSLVTSDSMVFKLVSEAYREKYGMVIAEKPPYEITYLQTEK